MKKIAVFLSVLLMLAALCLSASAAETAQGHNHKYYFDYISRSEDGSVVESFGLFCEDCDEVVHIKPNATVIDYNISYNGWGKPDQTEWYFIDGLVSLKEPVRINGTVNLVLLDNSLLICESGIRVFEDSTLNIYAEHLDYSPEGSENTMGALRAYVREEAGKAAAIGGLWETKNTVVNIYGGDILAVSDGWGAAIGSGYQGNTTVNIYGGKVRAITTNSGAAIGGGYDVTNAEINFYGGIVKASSTSDFVPSIGKGFWECHAKVNFFGGYVYGEPNTKVYSRLAGIDADSITRADGAQTIGNIDGIYDSEGLLLAEQAGWINDSGYPVGSVLSGGSLAIIVGVAALAVGFLVAMFIFKKKKPALADSADKDGK